MKYAVFFMRANIFASNSFVVAGTSGSADTTTSAWPMSVGSSSESPT